MNFLIKIYSHGRVISVRNPPVPADKQIFGVSGCNKQMFFLLIICRPDYLKVKIDGLPIPKVG